MNQAISAASQVRPPHVTINTDLYQHSPRNISEDPVYADVDMALTIENVAYEQTSEDVKTIENVTYEQTSGNVKTIENVTYEQTSGNVKTFENVSHGHCEVLLHDKHPHESGTTPQEAEQVIEDEEDYI